MQHNPITNNSVRSDVSQETLSDYVRRIRKEKHLSVAEVSRQSARFGKRISGSYVNRLENYPQLKVSAHRLKALAKGLGIPVSELMARATGDLVAGGTSDDGFLLTRFRELSRERKDDVLKIVDLWYSERADSRCEREPALHSQFLTRLRERNDHAKRS